MAVNLPPTGGGAHQIGVDIIFRIHQAGLQEAGRALQQFGFQHMANIGQAQQNLAQSQDKLQAAFQRSVSGIQALGRQTGDYERALRQTVATTELFIRRNMQLTPEQAAAFQQQRQQIAGIDLQREKIISLGREATRSAERVIQFNRALERVGRLRAAGVPAEIADPMERRVLRRGVGEGFATPEQTGRLKELDQQAQRAGASIRLFGESIPLGRTVAWAAAFSIVYTGLRLLTQLISEVTIGAVRRLADFQQRQIVLAAELINIRPELPFQQASRTARVLLESLQELQPAFIGTQENFQEILVATLRYFGGVDLASARGRTAFLTFANAVVSAQIGINRAGSAFREVAAIMEGVQRPGAQLLTLLVRIDPEITRNVQRWRQLGGAVRVLEEITKLLPGYKALAEEVGRTLPGQFQRLGANVNIALRQIAEPFAPILMGALRFVNGLLGAEIAGRRVVAILSGLVSPIQLASQAAELFNAVFRRQQAEFERLRDIDRERAETTRSLTRFLFETQEGLRAATQAGLVGAEELNLRLKTIVLSLQDAAGATQESRQEFNRYASELLQSTEALRRLREEQRLFIEFDARLSESRRRARMDPSISGEQRAAREQIALTEARIEEQRTPLRRQRAQIDTAIERSLVRQALLQEQLARTSLADREARALVADQLRLEEAAFPILLARRADATSKIVDLEKSLTGTLEEQTGRARQLVELNLERQRIVVESTAVVLRSSRDEINARLIEINLAEREALLRAGAIEEERNIRARFTAERRRAVDDEVRQRLEQLLNLRDAVLRAEAEMARARGEAVQAPAEARRAAADFQTFFLQQAPSDETVGQMRERFRRIRELQEGAAASQIAAVRERLRGVPGTVEAAPLRLELLGRLRDLLIQQAQAQSQLNQQEREALRTARERNLDEDIRIQERRLGVLARIGAPESRVRGAQEELGRLRQLRELRGRSRRELEAELEDIPALLGVPGLTPQARADLLERGRLIRQVLVDTREEQQQAAEAPQSALRRLQDIGKEIQSSLQQIADAQAGVAARARLEYEQFFRFLEQRLPDLVRFFEAVGDAAGRAFVQSARRHMQTVFPRPGEAPFAPVEAPGIGAPGITRRGELPAPAPAGLIGGLGGGAQVPAPPTGAAAQGPINVALSVTGPPQGPTIVVGNLDITPRLSEETISAIVGAVLGAQGDVGVKRERRNVPAGGSVI